MNGPSEQTNLLYDTTFLSFWPAFELMSQFAGGGNWETVWVAAESLGAYIHLHLYLSVSQPTFAFITD